MSLQVKKKRLMAILTGVKLISYGLNYKDTFSLITKIVTIQTLISLTSCHNFQLWQLHVKNAFLYGELDLDILLNNHKVLSPRSFQSMCVDSRRRYVV